MCNSVFKDYVKITKRLDSTNKVYLTNTEREALGAAEGDILELLILVKKKATKEADNNGSG